jgi:hypothetical protein
MGVQGGPVARRRVVGAVVVDPDSSAQFLREETETDVPSEDDGFEGVSGRQRVRDRVMGRSLERKERTQ